MTPETTDFLRPDHILRTPQRLQQHPAKPHLQPTTKRKKKSKKKRKKEIMSHMYLTLQGEIVGNRILGLGKEQVLEMSVLDKLFFPSDGFREEVQEPHFV